MHEDLSKMTTLGSADADDDSMAAWVARSRQSEETRRAAERAAATRVASMYDQEVFRVPCCLNPPWYRHGCRLTWTWLVGRC